MAVSVYSRKPKRPSDPGEAFRNYLGRQGAKYTAARRKILDAVLRLREHFEAEEVLYLLRERGEKVGKATVYRTLPLLVEAGILRQVRFDVKHAHYEQAWGEPPHDHLVCRRCGRIIEFGADEVTALRMRIASKHRFQVLGHRFQILGFCADCSGSAAREGRA